MEEARQKALSRLDYGRYSALWALIGMFLLAALGITTAAQGSLLWVSLILFGGAGLSGFAAIREQRWRQRQHRVVREGKLVNARVLPDPRLGVFTRDHQSGTRGTKLWPLEIELETPGEAVVRMVIWVYLRNDEAKWIGGRRVPVLWHPDDPEETVLAI